MERQIKKLDELMDGALTERFNQVLDEVMRNAVDPNTDPKAKRQVKIVIDVISDDGTITATEVTNQVPGQLAMDGTEQDLPNVLQFNAQKKAQEQ